MLSKPKQAGNVRQHQKGLFNVCWGVLCHVLEGNFSGPLLAALNHSYFHSYALGCQLMIHKLLGKSRKLAREKKYPELILLGHERGRKAFTGSFVPKQNDQNCL